MRGGGIGIYLPLGVRFNGIHRYVQIEFRCLMWAEKLRLGSVVCTYKVASCVRHNIFIYRVCIVQNYFVKKRFTAQSRINERKCNANLYESVWVCKIVV